MSVALLISFAFVIGLIIGSFANVVILRWGTGRSVGGRSSCASCGHQLTWYELIPVLSFLMQRGRCRSCDSRISSQYAIVELTFGILFAASVCSAASASMLGFDYGFLIVAWMSIFLLLSIAVYDIKHFIIPDGLVYAYIVLSFAWGAWSQGGSREAIVGVLVSGFITALPLFLLWAVSRGRWMGFGDVKLSLGMGMMLGTFGGLSALTFGVWSGAIISLLVIAYGKILHNMRFARGNAHLTMKSEIPFGPFLVAGTLFVFLSHMTLAYFIGAF